MKTMFGWLKKRFSGSPRGAEVVGKYYRRTGDCTLCGKCCQNIYLIHDEQTITSVEQFEALKPLNPDYQSFRPMDETEHGVTFACIHLQEDNSCGVYDDRPEFCRRYPNEEGLLKGGYLPPECGYQFEVLKPFSAVLRQTANPSLSLRGGPKARRGNLLRFGGLLRRVAPRNDRLDLLNKSLPWNRL